MSRIKFSLPQRLVASIANTVKPENFVEIGTCTDDTCQWAASYFKNVCGITSNSEAKKNGSYPANVKFLQADKLEETLAGLQGQTVFFVNSLPIEKNDKTEVSLQRELKAISEAKSPIIFINNAYYLGGALPYANKYNNWPTLNEVFTLCKALLPDSYVTLIDGQVICVPSKMEGLLSAYWAETFEERFFEQDPEPRKRSILERVKSRSRRIINEKFKKKEPVAYNIRESVWFQNELKKFYNAHRWLEDLQFNTIIDIGANVGQFGKKIRQYYPNAHLYSFEPIPFVYDELKLNFKGDPNFTAINAGVGDTDGKTKFHLNLFSDSSSVLEVGELHKKNYPYTKDEIEIEVEIKKLDSCLKVEDLRKPYMVKIDVQGFEEQVIDGGMEVISNADMIITESSYKELYKGQSLFDALYDKLKAMGFDFMGNLEQMESDFTGEPLQGDAIFMKRK